MAARTTDVDDALSTMDPHHLACRYRRHWWDPHTATAVRGGYDIVEVCRSCATRRHTILARDWGVTSVSYDYPDGYLVKGLGALSGADRNRVRRAVLAPQVHP